MRLGLCIVAAGAWATAAAAGDWPQILGPTRNGIAAADERLADAWPADGPRTVWSREAGAGYAGVAVVGERVILFHRVGDREVVEALDAATGKPLWSDGHRTTFAPQVGGGNGPLCVPLVAGGRVVVFGAQGVLACLDLTTGRRLWTHETHREFGADEGYFGAGSTPVVAAGRVIVNVGGRKVDGVRGDAGIVAFDLETGGVSWRATAEPASYAAPVAVDVGGAPHVLLVARYQCLLLDAGDGAVRWRFPFGQRGPTVNAATPLVFPDGHLLVTASYGIGSVYAAFDRQAARTVWQGVEQLATQYCTPVELDGRLYAIDGRDDVPPADFVCLDRRTGRAVWREAGFGYGTLLAADGKLVVATTDGDLVLARPRADGIEILARARPFPAGATLRPLPALARGRLYVRDEARLTCLEVGR